MSTRRLKLLPVLLVILLIFLQYCLWFESGGIIDMMRAKKKLAIEAQQNEKLKVRNKALLEQVQRLHKNNEALESRARHELGMVKNGETFYQVVH